MNAAPNHDGLDLVDRNGKDGFFFQNDGNGAVVAPECGGSCLDKKSVQKFSIHGSFHN